LAIILEGMATGMDPAKRPTDEPLLTTGDLAAMQDFTLGGVIVSPSTRALRGPNGSEDLEPRVMQVLVVLADAAGQVVTRETLFNRCWGGVYVGDDSLNRAIASMRRAVAAVGGRFEVATIPRTGYRLTVPHGDAGEPGGQPEARRISRRISRRMLVGGGLAATAVAGAGGIWWVNRPRTDPRFDALMERGNDALRLDQPGAKYFQQAAEVEPRSARAWGLVAYSLAYGGIPGSRAVAAPTLQAAERAARTALEIDPKEPNALLAMTFVESGTLNWLTREDRLRRVLAIDPENTLAMRSLGQLLHGSGRCLESLTMAERALVIEPLSPGQHFRKALELWVVGRVADADRDINRSMELWPLNSLVRLARLMIYAFTGRVRAALALIDEEERVPIFSSKTTAFVWRTSLIALETRTASAIEAAREVNIDESRRSPPSAAGAIVLLSALGQIDAAFEVANGFLLGGGSVIIPPSREAATTGANGRGWRNTYGLFTPPAKAMRLDPRFKPLADGLGLTEYWRKRGIGPDAFLFKA
jgi:DNA-binding winged helix-turn-helix (wHTH) protein